MRLYISKFNSYIELINIIRNNHLAQHRSGLREALTKFNPPVRLVALNWSLDRPPAMVHRICSDRVQDRGENHQSLRADTKKSHEDVLWMFIDKSEELSEAEVDDIIEMDVEEDLEANLRRAIDGLCRVLEIPRPEEEKIGEAVAIARNYAYRPTEKELAKEREAKGGGKKKEEHKQPRYFAILPEIDLKQIVEDALSSLSKENPASKLYQIMKSKNRLASRPHITIVHSKSLPDEQQLWDNATALHLAPLPPAFRFKLDSLVCNNRVMALSITEIIENTDAEDGGFENMTQGNKENDLAAPFLKTLLPIRFKLHITVGTADRDINPFEARQLVEEWRRAGAEEGVKQDKDGQLKWAAVKLNDLWSCGRVKGLMS